ncbi:glutamate racemase [Microgenomates bacterium UTCPR1]|nr:glutamate racemase [Patescibacteria group bacterium]OQY67842.1 MAG: glutamate racemase [Microgenomates bacterium UTCPR1]
MKIGVFDSGLGGLTILKQLLKSLPKYDYVYYGDNARVPYGNRSPQVIYGFTKEAVDLLVNKNCSLIILACNTATATSLRKIQQDYLPNKYPGIRVLGVIRPIVELAAERGGRRIGVIGTKSTVATNAFVSELRKMTPNSIVFQQACPLLVPYIEDSMRNQKILDLLLKEYLDPLKKAKIDSLILGCTHYEIIKEIISAKLGKDVVLYSEGEAVAIKLRDYLLRHPEIENSLGKDAKVEYNFSDPDSDYKRLIKLFLDA